MNLSKFVNLSLAKRIAILSAVYILCIGTLAGVFYFTTYNFQQFYEAPADIGDLHSSVLENSARVLAAGSGPEIDSVYSSASLRITGLRDTLGTKLGGITRFLFEPAQTSLA